MKNDIFEAEKGILEELKKLLGDKYTYVHGYIEEQNYKSRLANGETKEEIPYILIRALDIEHKHAGISFEKRVKFLIQVTLQQEKTSEGYQEILNVTNKIVDFLAQKTIKENMYNIDDNKDITARINEYYTDDKYWSYDIFYSTALLPAQTGELCKSLGL